MERQPYTCRGEHEVHTYMLLRFLSAVRSCCFRQHSAITAVFCLSLAASPGHAQQVVSHVLSAMKTELSRSQEKLKSQPIPPYYLSYEVTETHSFGVSGAFGQITNSSENRLRQLDVDLRVGDYSLDNTREIRGEPSFLQFSAVAFPIENDPDAIRAVLWYHTDQRYKSALEQFTKVKTNVQVKVAQEDAATDTASKNPD